MKAAAMGHVLAGQQQLDLFKTFGETGNRFVRRPAEATKLVWQKGTRKPDIEAPAADRVQHADFTGEFQRMVKDRQHCTGHQPRVMRTLRGSGQEQHRVWAVPAVGMKIMLDDADVREPELLRVFHKRERIAEVIRTRFLIGPDVGKKLQTKSHARLSAGRGYARRAGRQPSKLRT